MNKLFAAATVSTFMAACVLAANQPPEGKGPPGGGNRKGPPGAEQKQKGGGGRFELGRVLPGPMREELGLSEEQAKMIDALDKDVKDRLNKILNDDQKQKLNDLGRRGPRFGGGDDKGKGPPPGDDDRPRGKGERKGPPREDDRKSPPADDDRPGRPRGDKKAPPPPPRIDDEHEQAQGGIQWFGTLDRGLAEAARTGRPILFLAAAPHCGGIPGIW
jgi:hypothetical protein